MSTSEAATPTAAVAVDYDPFAEPAITRTAPTTETQREIWLAASLGADASLSYNESVSLRFGGELDLPGCGRRSRVSWIATTRSAPPSPPTA